MDEGGRWVQRVGLVTVSVIGPLFLASSTNVSVLTAREAAYRLSRQKNAIIKLSRFSAQIREIYVFRWSDVRF